VKRIIIALTMLLSLSLTVSAEDSVNPAVLKLVRAGATVLGADLLFQGGEPVKQIRVVANPREFAGYTFGYNHALFAQRTHDGSILQGDRHR